MSQPSAATASTGTALTCLNAVTHGGSSRKLFISGESPDDFFALLESLFQEFEPGTMNTAALVTDAAFARWHVWRRQRAASANEAALSAAKPDESTWTTEDLHRIQIFDRYKIEAEHALRRALLNVQNAQKNAVRETQWQALYELQKQRFDLDVQRFKLAQEQDSRVADMKLTQSRLAALKAEEALALKVERSLQLSLCCKEMHHGQLALRQHVMVSANGDTVLNPSNKELRAGLQNIMNHPPSRGIPKTIARRFYFDGPTPPEYRWLLADPNDTRPNFTTVSLIPVKTWLPLSQKEDALPQLRALPHLPQSELTRKEAA